MFRRVAPVTSWIKRVPVHCRLLTGLAAALVCMYAAPVAGQQVSSPELRQAIEAYDAGELQRALSLLEAAPALLDPHDSAIRSLYTGLVQFALGETTAARLSFARAVRTEPGIDLDPMVHSPARVAAFQAARKDVVAEFRASAIAADGQGDPAVAEARWRVVLLSTPGDEEATRRLAAIERDRQREAAALSAAAAATDTVTRPLPPSIPATVPDPAAAGTRLNPGRAFAMGLLVPGLGHFYAGKALRGVIALGAASGVIAAGYLSERLEIECGSVPDNNVCPGADILDERTRRPYLAPAIAAAAGIAVIGAIDAMIAARRSNAAAPPTTQSDPPSPRLLAPSFSSVNGVLRAELVRIRFR